jgi:hypothetical protein
MGLPPMERRIFSGKRVEPSRAGIIPKAFIEIPLKYQDPRYKNQTNSNFPNPNKINGFCLAF